MGSTFLQWSHLISIWLSLAELYALSHSQSNIIDISEDEEVLVEHRK